MREREKERVREREQKTNKQSLPLLFAFWELNWTIRPPPSLSPKHSATPLEQESIKNTQRGPVAVRKKKKNQDYQVPSAAAQ